jgi:hypothetical protein
MANTSKMCDFEITSINEECLVDAEVEMLELNLTQLSKTKKNQP